MCQIKPSITKKEIKNRIRAISYPNKLGYESFYTVILLIHK